MLSSGELCVPWDLQALRGKAAQHSTAQGRGVEPKAQIAASYPDGSEDILRPEKSWSSSLS